jgi:hypothetical protein
MIEREVHPRSLMQHRGDEPSATNLRPMQGIRSLAVGDALTKSLVSPWLPHDEARMNLNSIHDPETLTDSKGLLLGRPKTVGGLDQCAHFSPEVTVATAVSGLRNVNVC